MSPAGTVRRSDQALFHCGKPYLGHCPVAGRQASVRGQRAVRRCGRDRSGGQPHAGHDPCRRKALDRGGTPMSGRGLIALLSVLLLLVPAQALACELRVCADPNNLPYSNRAEEGFENRIVELLAKDLGATVKCTWWAQRRGAIRNTLGAGTWTSFRTSLQAWLAWRQRARTTVRVTCSWCAVVVLWTSCSRWTIHDCAKLSSTSSWSATTGPIRRPSMHW